jgi:hypothetical protein
MDIGMLLNSVHGNKKSRKTTKLYWPLEAQERGRAGSTNSGCGLSQQWGLDWVYRWDWTSQPEEERTGGFDRD